jgi:hypothetical protein
LRNNPLLSYLIRKSGPPALWLTAIFCGVVVGWSILTMQPGLIAMLDQNAAMPDAHTPLYFAALLLLLGGPVTVAVNAAVFTVRHNQPENLKALKLKRLTGGHIAWGYALSALYRMRVLLALAVGLTPAFVIGSVEVSLVFFRVLAQDCVSGAACGSLTPGSVFDAGPVLTASTLIAVGMLGLGPLGAALGTWTALTWRRPVPASALAVAGVGALLAAFVMLIGPLANIPTPVAVGAMLTPYLLGGGIMWLAGHEAGG